MNVSFARRLGEMMPRDKHLVYESRFRARARMRGEFSCISAESSDVGGINASASQQVTETNDRVILQRDENARIIVPPRLLNRLAFVGK